MNIRKAAEADIDAVTEIYDHIHDEEESCSIGRQRGAYTVRATAETAVSAVASCSCWSTPARGGDSSVYVQLAYRSAARLP